jgi:hypothetical protein
MTGVNTDAMLELMAIREDPSKGGVLLNEAIREIDEARGNAASWQRLARELEETRDRLRDAGETMYVALSRYFDQNYPCDNQPEIERAMVAWQDTRCVPSPRKRGRA